MEVKPEILNEFAVEGKEHIGFVEKKLLELEKQAHAPDRDTIASIFRSVHGIKGSAGFLGLKGISSLSHSMETLLGMMRSNEIVPDSHIIDLLLSGIDILGVMLDDLEHSNDLDTTSILSKINSAIDNKTSSEMRMKMDKRISMTDTLDIPLDMNIRAFDLDNLPKNHDNFFLLKYDLTTLGRQGGLSPVKLLNKLLLHGEILDAKLDMETPDLIRDLNQDLSNIPFIYKILFATPLDYDSLKQAAELGRDNIIKVKKADVRDNEFAEKAHEPGEKFPAVPDTLSRDSGKSDSVRISVDILDKLMILASELVLVRNQQLLCTDMNNPVQRTTSQRLDIITSELQETIMRTRMQPIGKIFDKLPRIVRDLEHKLGKKICLTLKGKDVELDKTILESLSDPLVHLIRNSCDHGIEVPDTRKKLGKPGTGNIFVNAWHEAGRINIEIKDDGSGIDINEIKKNAVKKALKTEAELEQMEEKDICFLIFHPGFSTAAKVNDVSGRGVGMDVVKTSAEDMGGTLDIESSKDIGTKICLRLPLTLAIIPCLIVISGENRYAIPQVNVEEIVSLYDRDACKGIECAGNREVFRLRNRLLPIVRLGEVLAEKQPFTEDICARITGKYFKQANDLLDKPDSLSGLVLKFAVVKAGTHRFGLIVDQVAGTEEIVVKPLHPAAKNLGIYSGSTIMGDGSVALILNIEGIASHADVKSEGIEDALEATAAEFEAEHETQRVLLLKYGQNEQFAVSLALIRRVERIRVNRIEKISDKEFINIDGVSTLLVRPEKELTPLNKTEREDMPLILPKHIRRPAGILFSSVVDVVETSLEISTDAYMADGILGTSIINNQMTLFPDIYRLIELNEPQWFAQRREQKPPGINKKILLAEDAPFFRQVVKGYLESDNYEVSTAADGKQALEKLAQENYDLVISDLEMPVMDGFELVKQIRKNPEYKNIQVIALTSLDSKEDKSRAEQAGFDMYHVKLDRENLLGAISMIFKTIKAV